MLIQKWMVHVKSRESSFDINSLSSLSLSLSLSLSGYSHLSVS